MCIVSSLEAILLSLFPVFSQPSGQLFLRMVVGWIVCPTRRTITAMIPYADPDGYRTHDAYHRFFRVGAWGTYWLFRLWSAILVETFCRTGIISLKIDDTVHKKTGRKVDGAAFRRDAVRSTAQKVVYVWGLQIVAICLSVSPPWGGEPLALPVNVRLYRKGGPSLLDLANEMMRELDEWFDGRVFSLAGDGFYASLAGRALPHTRIVSRMRYDAAIYQMPGIPPRRRRGRPRKKGTRLPTPRQMASRVRTWNTVRTIERGKVRTRNVYSRPVLWYQVLPDRPVLLVISRDPAGKEKDDFFFTTDLSMSPAEVITEFADRWAIEDTFRNTKQFLGAEEPQSWKGKGPEKVATFSHFLYGLIWLWYIKHAYRSTPLPSSPWYPQKRTPSFKDALAALRKAIWSHRFSHTMGANPHLNKCQALLIDALAYAA
jgi:hypothetical protein